MIIKVGERYRKRDHHDVTCLVLAVAGGWVMRKVMLDVQAFTEDCFSDSGEEIPFEIKPGDYTYNSRKMKVLAVTEHWCLVQDGLSRPTAETLTWCQNNFKPL